MNILDMTIMKKVRVIIIAVLVLCVVAGTVIGCSIKKHDEINTPDETDEITEDPEQGEIPDTPETDEISLKIYRCDDVYRHEGIPAYGSATVYVPIHSDYAVNDVQVLLCDDGCDPTDVLSRAFWGYAPTWRIDQYTEYTAEDGWNYNTRAYKNIVPKETADEMKAQGATESIYAPREYPYLLNLDETHYAYITIEPKSPEEDRPENEQSLVDDIIKNVRVDYQAVADESTYNKAVQPETDDLDTQTQNNRYYLSITGEYIKESELREVCSAYSLYDGAYTELIDIPSTSDYACSVCDISNGMVYYSAGEEVMLSGKLCVVDNVYSYNVINGETKQLTTDGVFSRKLIKAGDRLYFVWSPRSSVETRFGWIDLNSGEIVYPDIYSDVNRIEVRDIGYSFVDNRIYIAWLSGEDQRKLNNNAKDGQRELVPAYIDVIDAESMERTNIAKLTDFHPLLISPAQNGSKIYIYGMEPDKRILMIENGSINDFNYPGTPLSVLSEDDNTVFYAQKDESKTGTVLYAYDLMTDSIRELIRLPYSVKGMTLVRSEKDEFKETHILEEEIVPLMERYLLHEKYTVYSSLDVDFSVKDESGRYFKVSNEDFDTWDEWISFIESIFTGDSLTSAAPNPESYKNIDGYTYCSPGDMGWYISQDYTYEITRRDAKSAVVQISRFENVPGEERTERKWYFDLMLTENGWRINNISKMDFIRNLKTLTQAMFSQWGDGLDSIGIVRENGVEPDFIQYADNLFPVFINGDYVINDPYFVYPTSVNGEKKFYLDIFKAVSSLFEFSSYDIGDKNCVISYSYGGKEHNIKLDFKSNVASSNGEKITLSAVPVLTNKILENGESESHLYLPPDEIATLCGAEYAYADNVSYKQVTEFTSYKNSSCYYLYNVPHMMLWKYPEKAKVIGEEEALGLVKEALITAYEQIYGEFVPLETKPEKYDGDEIMLRWSIPNIRIISENDRFWRMENIYDFLVDKYSGEIFTHYNGIVQVFSKYDPYSPGALAFAG